jgi:hypothetical protein
VVIFILEKIAKFALKLTGMLLALFGIRYLLLFIGIIIPLEWFIIIGCGMMGMYGLVVLTFYILIVNLL